jgi:hypothetical protein
MNRTVSFSIMMHPSRKHLLPYLLETLGKDTPVSMDTDNNIWHTCREAWKLHNPKADYHFVIQDDVLFTDDFHNKVKKLLTKGEYVYNLYLGRPRLKKTVFECKRKGRNHIIANHIYHEIALGIPTKYINEMIEYGDSINAEHDKHINNFIRSKGLKVYFPLPSLINHRADKSLHPYNKGSYKAVATWFE